MEAIAFFVLIGIFVCFVLPLIAIAKASAARRAIEDFELRLRGLEAEFASLGHERSDALSEALLPRKTDVAAPPASFPSPEPQVPEPRPTSVPPPLPTQFPPPATESTAAAVPPPIPVQPESIEAPGPRRAGPAIDWEQFMGAKLFAWIGGLALFLGVGFFVKYSFEHNLIPPELRVAIGFVVGLALVIGGVTLKRKENAVTAQTLCATGILILYAVTFACRSYYHFAFFGLFQTFVLMTLITAAAFFLSVRLDAIVVAILGIAGGFLTPILLRTGQDNPFGLFGYIALLDIGLLAVARRREWSALPVLGAVGTILMQIAWVAQFFLRDHYYYSGNKVLVPMAIFLGLALLFCAASGWVKRGAKSENALSASALGMGGITLCWAFYFLAFPTLGHHPLLLFGYVFAVDLSLLAVVFLRDKLAPVGALIGMVVFAFLGIWTGQYLTNANLNVALGSYFLFAVLHSSTPIALQRLRKIEIPKSSHLFPALTLLLVLMPILRLPGVSFLVWPLVLCVDVIAILLAAATATLAPILVVLLVTFVVVGGWIFRLPNDLAGLPSSLFLLGGFAVFFMAAEVWVCRHLLDRTKPIAGGKLFGNLKDPANFAIQLPALSATLPFVLLIMVTQRLPLANPSAVFSLALLLTVILLGMAKMLSLDLLPAVGLACVLALEHAWHFQHFNAAQPLVPLFWYLGFAALFTVFPFVFHRQFAAKTLPWAISALASPLHFFLVYQLIRSAYANGIPGLVPAAFSVPSLLGLILILKRTPVESRARNAQLALFGGAALFFITLIFPIQFDREWITVGWALEGLALCWLFHRVPHPGLPLVGTGLLSIAFVRLALNPAVLSYHVRSGTPILNWYLYAYGIVALSLFVAARLLAPPRDLVLGRTAPPFLYALATILTFLLLNIEIADFFSHPGSAALTFQFTGNFARDMSYSIAWAAFALLLLVVGIRTATKGARYASMALLGLTILKLFLHDLSQLEQLYRIAAFIIVAIIAIVASFLYQRFLGVSEKEVR